MSFHRKDKEAGRYLDPAGKPQNYLSLFGPANDHENLSIPPLFGALLCPHCLLCVGAPPPLEFSGTQSPCWVAPGQSFSSWFDHVPLCFPVSLTSLTSPSPMVWIWAPVAETAMCLPNLPFPPMDIARLHSPAVPVVGCGRVTKFWSM